MDDPQSPIREAVRQTLERGDLFKVLELAWEGLAENPANSELRFLQTLALARLGESEAAIRAYGRNRIEDIGTEDAIALKARILKDLALRAKPTDQAPLFRKSSETYRLASKLDDGYFSKINEATTAFLAGDSKRAAKIARSVVSHPEIVAGQTYFALATLGEALLLLGEFADAARMFRAARLMPDATPGALASTTRQMGVILSRLPDAGDRREELLAAVRPAPILHYCGHMFTADWAGAPPLVTEISRTIDEMGSSIAYGSLACGSDILIAEAILERGGELHVVLPFLEEDFLKSSVLNGGAEWLPRYRNARAKAASVTFATQMQYVNDDNQFAHAARLAMGMARLRSRTMQTDAVQLSVWDGVPTTTIAGTAADIAEWSEQKGATRIIPIPKGRPALAASNFETATDLRVRTLRAIIFADFSGFSRLSERMLPGFLDFVMGSIGAVLDKHGKAVLCRNSWGDAIFCIVDTPSEAAAIALEIQSALCPTLLQQAGLPDDGGMRISLHCGPIYEDFDPVQQARTYYGSEVTLAARIEPRVPVGSIFTTQHFAALIDPRMEHLFSFEYVGTMELAKNYGPRALYRLMGSVSEH